VRATTLAFQAQDRALLIGGADGRIYRWRFQDELTASSFDEIEKTLERYAAHQTIISTLVPHPFGRAFFSADIQGSLFAWLPYDADDYAGEYDRSPFGGRFFSAPGTYAPAVRTKDRGIVSLAVSHAGDRLVLGTEDGFVEVWDVRGFSMAARKKMHEGRVYSVSIDDSGRTVASAGRDGKVVVARSDPDPQYRISLEAMRELLDATRTFPIPEVRRVAFLPDQQIVASTTDGTLAAITVDELPAAATPLPTPVVDGPIDSDY